MSTLEYVLISIVGTLAFLLISMTPRSVDKPSKPATCVVKPRVML